MQRLRWTRTSPNSTNNFDLVLTNPEAIDPERLGALLDQIASETHRGLTLSSRAIEEFRRWLRQPNTPLGSQAYVLLSNWFLTRSGDRHSMVASHCEALWNELFPCRPMERLSSPAAGKNHLIRPSEFERFWRQVLDAQAGGNGPFASNGRSRPDGSSTPDRTSAQLSSADNLRAVLDDKDGLRCQLEGSAQAVANFYRMVWGPRAETTLLEDEPDQPDAPAVAKAANGSPSGQAGETLSHVSDLPDDELWKLLAVFSQISRNLLTEVAAKVGKSVSYVWRVLAGQRRNAEIETVLLTEFRRRLQAVQTSADGADGSIEVDPA